MHGGTAFILTHTGYLDAMSKGIKQIINYGSADADYMAEPAEMDSSYLKLNITKGLSQPTLQTQLVGSYNLPNVLAALCIGKTFSVPDEKIKASIENYSPSNSRSQLIEKNGNKIILDAYNANPSSMTLAIENFAGLRGNKVLIIGSMMELGQAADEEHERIVDLITTFSWKAVVLTGNGFKKIPAHFLHFNNVEETAEWYKKQQFKDCLILIKGSRSMQMEKLLDWFFQTTICMYICNPLIFSWRRVRVVEGARLESVYTGNCIKGSNPFVSAFAARLSQQKHRTFFYYFYLKITK